MAAHDEPNVAPSAESSPKSETTTPTISVYGNDLEKGADPEKSTEKPHATAPAPTTPAIGPPPDGGAQAWLVVLGAFSGLFVSFGWINCRCHSQRKPAIKLTFTRHWSFPSIL